jgi:hypothetical protein
MRRWIGLLTAAIALVVPVGAQAHSAVSGSLNICNGAGNPPSPAPVTFSIVAPASEGGTQLVTLASGACNGKYWFTQGLQVTVIATLSAGTSVTNIAIKGDSTLSGTSLAGAVTTVTIGSSDSVLTFTTKGSGAPALRDCVVPRVVGTTLTSARKAIKRAACRVKSVSYVYSARIPKGGVTSTKPRAGARLRHNYAIRVYVSRGAKP